MRVKILMNVLMVNLIFYQALALNVDGTGDPVQRSKVTALYRFNNANIIPATESTLAIVKDISGYKNASGVEEPLNLEIVKPYAIINDDFVQLSDPNLIRSVTSADKIVNECRASNAMTVELWIQTLTPTEKLVHHEDDERDAKEAMRIVSLSDNYFKEFSNFSVMQGYNMGDAFKAAITTSDNTSARNIRGGIINNFVTNREATMVNQLQHIFIVRNSAGNFKFYSSNPNPLDPNRAQDPSNQDLYIAAQTDRVLSGRMTGNLNAWYVSGGTVTFDTPTDKLGVKTKVLDMRLAFGNEPSAGNKLIYDAASGTYKSELDSAPKFNPTVGPTYDAANVRNHFWKGRLYMAAIYCSALTEKDILGAAAPRQDSMPSFPINLNTNITPALKKAQTIYNRLNSVHTPLTNPRLEKMANLMSGGTTEDLVAAAEAAIEDSTDGTAMVQDTNGTYYSPSFYNITVRDFATPMSNRDETVGAPLNDFVATIIGATRKSLDARKLLYENITFEAELSKAAVPSNPVRDILTSNSHYESLQEGGYDLVRVLVQKKQKLLKCQNPTSSLQQCIDNKQAEVVDFPDGESAGLLTSRAFMQSHAIAGTNRRMLQYSFQEFLCTPMEQWSNTTRSDAPVGRDVDRFPGGSHYKFTTSCKGCHSGMDPLRTAFAYFTFSNNFIKHSSVSGTLAPTDMNEDNRVGMKVGIKNDDPALTKYSAPERGNIALVSSKYNHNENIYPDGGITKDNTWYNAAKESWAQNHFGWTGPMSGQGASSYGRMLASSGRFPVCMAQRVFKTLCKRDPQDFDLNLIKTAADEFVAKGYDLKYLFKRIVVGKECIGE